MFRSPVDFELTVPRIDAMDDSTWKARRHRLEGDLISKGYQLTNRGGDTITFEGSAATLVDSGEIRLHRSPRGAASWAAIRIHVGTVFIGLSLLNTLLAVVVLFVVTPPGLVTAAIFAVIWFGYVSGTVDAARDVRRMVRCAMDDTPDGWT